MRNGENAGAYNAPGLPGITGSVNVYNASTQENNFTTGAFFTGNIAVSNRSTMSGTGDRFLQENFDASRSSKIYGASSSVMPASVDLVCAIYLGMYA